MTRNIPHGQIIPKVDLCGQIGFCGTYGKHFSSFEFFLLPSRGHAGPLSTAQSVSLLNSMST